MKTFIFALAVLVSFAQGLDVNDCGSKGAEILKLDFPSCDEEPCVVHKDDQLRAKLYLKSKVSTDYLDCQLKAVLNGVEIPYPGGCDEPDACNALLEGECPIKEGDEIVYDIIVDGKWMLMDENDEVFSCFNIQMDIRD